MTEPRPLLRVPFSARPGRLGSLLLRFTQPGSWVRSVELAGEAGLLTLDLPPGVDPARLPLEGGEGPPTPLAALEPYVLTVLAPANVLGPLAAVVGLVEQIGGVVQRVRLLSEAPPIAHELAVSLPVAEVAALRARLLLEGRRDLFDVVLQPDGFARTRRRLVVLDVDSTVIRIEVIDELARAAGRYEQVAAITERAMRGELDFQASLRERVAALAGVPLEALDAIAANLPLSDGAEALFAALHALGIRTAVLSGGFLPPVRALQRRLRIDHAYANELEVEEGRLTGRVIGPIVDAERKAALLAELAAEHRIPLAETLAVGDGANDRLMLQRAGLGVAFRAKPRLREVAHGCLDVWGLDGLLPILGLHARELRALL